MTIRPVLGGGPISILDGAGKQLEIPLNLLSFNDSGLDASGWPSYAANKALVDPWINSLVQRQLLRPGQAPAAAPALVIAARDKGSEGNTISIAISNVKPAAAPAVPGDTTVDVTVTVTQAYPGLTAASIVSELGTTATNGSQPGLAIVKAGTVKAPDVAVEGDFSGGPPAKWAPLLKDGATVAFTLNARNNDDPDSVNPHGAITAVVPGATPADTTFTLTLSWRKTKTGVKLSNLGTAFVYVLNVSAPPSGFAPPAAGVFNLIGGADASSAAAAAAQATVLAA